MSTLTALAPVTKTVNRRLPAITREQYEDAKDRYMHGELTESIAADLGCKRNVLDCRFSRDGLPARRFERLKDGRGDRTKEKIAAAAESIVDALGERAPKSAEGLNLHADTLGKVTKAAALVHGWGEHSTVAVIVGGVHLGVAEPEPEAIDIE